MSFLDKFFKRSSDVDERLDSDLFREIAENSADVIFRMDLGEKVSFVSPSCTAVFGWSQQEMLEMGPAAIVHPDDLAILLAKGRQLRDGAIDGEVTEYRVRHKNGHYVWVQSNSRLSPGASGGPGDLIVVLRDISQTKQLEQQLAALANTDGLTNLANRRCFDAQLENVWRQTLAVSSQLSLLLIDIDYFKLFNDRYGHLVGDDCLRTVSETLRKVAVDAGGFAARYGGEEMAVILPDHAIDEARAVAEAIRTAVLELAITHHENPESSGRVTVSIGVATALARSGGSVRMPEGLLMAADNALYKAKHAGRNRVETSLLMAESTDA